jgi:hypothetical protein
MTKINRTQENGSWTYHDQTEAEFVFIMVLEGVPMDGIDNFIEGHDGPLPSDIHDQLIGKRSEALQAFKAKNIDLAQARAETLSWMCRFYGFRIVAKPKIAGKLKSEKALRTVQPEGTKANKERADKNRADLNRAMSDFIDNYPNALSLGSGGLTDFLKKRNLTFGYSDASIETYAKPLFAQARKDIKSRQ